jgi:hypothetical protein
MSPTLLEGLVLLSVVGVGVVVWWGVLRLVSTNDQTLKALGDITTHLATINGRLGKSETWMELHQTHDDQEFTHIRDNLQRVWEKLDPPRS